MCACWVATSYRCKEKMLSSGVSDALLPSQLLTRQDRAGPAYIFLLRAVMSLDALMMRSLRS